MHLKSITMHEKTQFQKVNTLHDPNYKTFSNYRDAEQISVSQVTDTGKRQGGEKGCDLSIRGISVLMEQFYYLGCSVYINL